MFLVEIIRRETPLENNTVVQGQKAISVNLPPKQILRLALRGRVSVRVCIIRFKKNLFFGYSLILASKTK